MATRRNNHYVPVWYQRGFLEGGCRTLKYLDLKPPLHEREDGTKVPGRSLFTSAPAQCFYRTDLYSRFFGFHLDDAIERRLFGEIDTKGAAAVRAFKGTDVGAWVRHFEDFFEHIDAQKLRTPKGLDWLRQHYPFLDQNQLMQEMQGVRLMHVTLWTEGVREIVSAEDSEVKFLISDHPVTVYNPAVSPDDPRCAYPNDPEIAWKASQTLYPLDQNFCLILTNLEYAQDPGLPDRCLKRTSARNFRRSLISTHELIRTRRLNAHEVSQINFILKARATRYIAAGREEWLYPERIVKPNWASLRSPLLPPEDELGQFRGEIYVRYEDGRVGYQDALGRSEPTPDFLLKSPTDAPRSPRDPCGCGSGRRFRDCCAAVPAQLRPSWSECSIRERNILHVRAIIGILGLGGGKDWIAARKDLDDEKIARIYRAFRGLWPLDTDLIALLPKPDGRLRALYTGIVDPRLIGEYAIGASTYFGEILVQNPFVHSGCVTDEYSPTANPGHYRQEVLKHVALLLDLMPLVEAGIINLFPDPCYFDFHLRHQMMGMATERTRGTTISARSDPRIQWLERDDFRRDHWGLLPEDAQRANIRKAMPERSADEVEEIIQFARSERIADPLATLRDDPLEGLEGKGLLRLVNMVPNYEMSLYLAQATGSVIVTDSPFRWREFQEAAWYERGRLEHELPPLKAAIERNEHLFLCDTEAIIGVLRSGRHDAYRALLHGTFRYLTARGEGRKKPNWESQLPGRFANAHADMRKAIEATGAPAVSGMVQCLFPVGGVRDNTTDRLLLMTSVDHHLDRVPMAFFIQRPDSEMNAGLETKRRQREDYN